MSIGIIGYGVVGRAAEATLSRCYNVFKYDKFSEHDSFESLGNCKYVFISKAGARESDVHDVIT